MSASALLSPFSADSPVAPAPGHGGSPARGRVTCRAAADEAELDLHFRIREEVFVREQHVFGVTDRDAHDGHRETVHVLGACGAVACGTVRLYPLDEPGLWKGDRLAVLPAYRARHLGGPLVRFAVRTAGERGGRRMIAFIQPANVAFFERLGWSRVGDLVEYVGLPHQQMAIGLGGA